MLELLFSSSVNVPGDEYYTLLQLLSIACYADMLYVCIHMYM